MVTLFCESRFNTYTRFCFSRAPIGHTSEPNSLIINARPLGSTAKYCPGRPRITPTFPKVS